MTVLLTTYTPISKAARHASIEEARNGTSTATTDIIKEPSDVVAFDGGGFFYGREIEATAVFHANMLRGYDAYGLATM